MLSLTQLIFVPMVLLAVPGMLGNLLVLVTLFRHCYQSKFATTMILNQAALDFVVCLIVLLMALTYKETPVSTGPPSGSVMGLLVCHLWTSQLIYWLFVFSSVQNLILISTDRYLAVFRPLQYKQLGVKQAFVFIGAMNLYSVLVSLVDIFMVSYEWNNNRCSSTRMFNSPLAARLFTIYGIAWFFLVYLIPVISMSVIYTKIVIRLTRQANQISSKCQQKAAMELTKSAAAITIIFIILFAYDSIYFFLGQLGLVTYQFNSPSQLAGVLLVAMNSCISPIVYCIIMPSFRQRLLRLFCRKDTSPPTTNPSVCQKSHTINA